MLLSTILCIERRNTSAFFLLWKSCSSSLAPELLEAISCRRPPSWPDYPRQNLPQLSKYHMIRLSAQHGPPPLLVLLAGWAAAGGRLQTLAARTGGLRRASACIITPAAAFNFALDAATNCLPSRQPPTQTPPRYILCPLFSYQTIIKHCSYSIVRALSTHSANQLILPPPLFVP